MKTKVLTIALAIVAVSILSSVANAKPIATGNDDLLIFCSASQDHAPQLLACNGDKECGADKECEGEKKKECEGKKAGGGCGKEGGGQKGGCGGGKAE